MTQIAPSNRLAKETSPYLRQHANNPVDWFPWGDEALALAKQENKPVLLSIGYSACHWCHVMAHESFEDGKTAAVMNELFVNIKVDREERPDLDKIYQLSHQLLTRRSGGWPLTVFLNPHDQTPFFSGTYFPKEARYNLPAFASLLQQVSRYYTEQSEAVSNNGVAFREALQQLAREEGRTGQTDLDVALPGKLLRACEVSFDRVNGGFGGAPKFPHPSTLEFLSRQAGRSVSARSMLSLTLEKMAAGGIYDHLGGGFCRYAVDSEWLIPHFEKMLYDNAGLLSLYAKASRLLDSENLRRVAAETGAWVMREMQAPEGGYYSSLDADSEGVEGKFYVWDRSAVKALLTPEEYSVAALYFGLNETPNFEGCWHLHAEMGLEVVAERLRQPRERIQDLLVLARSKLLEARAERVRPGLDDKVLAAWNALMIKGMLVAGRTLQREDFIASGQQAFDFLHERLWRDDRLLATYKDGVARHQAYLDDHAFLLDAGLELLQTRWRSSDLLWIIQLANALLARFQNQESGGFYFTADDHEALIHRPSPMEDEATPSGNGIAALALARLGHLLGEMRYVDAAERVFKAACSRMSQYPQAHASLMMALEDWFNPPPLLVIRADLAEGAVWRSAAEKALGGELLCFLIPPDAADLPGLLAERGYPGHPVAYLCKGGTCLPPIESARQLADLNSLAV
ncbi:thioredoxin domain-containing protein [Methyloterricola oryzae]|uniref:thioredoxin domain-containing protein n=1 Tax=Methyloterricola oryzae TaxID=1495050 RepID=UPI0005EB2729|nr:thioredoxin domain-containing protein [Methyloterricola oryzae]